MKITLPTGVELTVQLAPFADANALYKAVLRELKGIQLNFSPDSDLQISHYLLQAFLGALSNSEVEGALWKCMERCLYGNSRIVKDTFEPEAAREDYLRVCIEVGKANIFPFLKSLFAEFRGASQLIQNATRKPISETSTTP